MSRLTSQHDLRQVDRFDMGAARPLRCRALSDGIDARELEQIALDRLRWYGVELRRRLRIEPAGVPLPDRAYVPRRLAMELPDLELRRQLDLAHERMYVL